MSQPRSSKPPHRRQFLGKVAGAGVAALAPTFVPAAALGRDGKVAASERIVLAGIGIGSRGEFDLRWMLKEPDVQFVKGAYTRPFTAGAEVVAEGGGRVTELTARPLLRAFSRSRMAMSSPVGPASVLIR